MKKYQYVRINGAKFAGAKFEEHRKIIDEYALQGFSFIGFIPVNIDSYGRFKEIDLIFEIERK